MSEWKSLRLGDHMEALSGFPFPSEGFSQETGLPLIRIRDLLADQIETHFVGSYPDDFVIDDGDILIGMDGDFNIVRWNKGKALLNQRVCKVFASTSQLDEGFLFWSLGPELKDIHQKTPQTTVKHLAVGDLSRLCLQVPPVDEQRVIAHILDTLDTQIQKTEALIAKLEKVKEGLLHDLLTRGIDENGQLRPSPEQAPELYKDSPLGTIPREWTSQRLGEVVSFKGGVGFPERAQGKKHGDFPFYKVSDMSIPGNEKLMRKANNYVTNSVAKGLGATPIAPRSVVFAKVGAALLLNRRRLLSTSSLLDNNMMAATATMGVHPEFLYWWMTRVDFGLLVQPGALPSINQSQMEKITIGLPPETEQRLISSRLETHDALIENKKRELPILNSLKSGLMDDLLTGRVRVTPLLEQAQAQGTTPA